MQLGWGTGAEHRQADERHDEGLNQTMADTAIDVEQHVDRPGHRDQVPISERPQRVRRSTSLLRLMRYMAPYRWRWIIVFSFSALVVVTRILVPLVTKEVVDGPISDGDQHGLLVLGSVVVVLGALEALFWFIRRWFVARASLGVESDIRKDLYARLQVLPMTFHSRWQSGQLLSRFMTDLSTIRRLLAFGLVFLVLNMLQILIVAGLLLGMYWPLGLVVLISVFPIAATVLRNQRRYTVLARTAQDQAGDVASIVEESAQGLRVIKSFGRGEYAYDKFDSRAVRLYDTQLLKVRLRARFWMLLEVIPNITLMVVLGLGVYAVGRDQVSIGTLVAFVTMMMSLVWPISSLGFLISMTQESMTAADRVVEVFDEPRGITGGTLELTQPQGRLVFENVGYRYPDAEPDEWVLRGVDLSLEPGETVALVGATGSGKTLMTSLVGRSDDVTEGRITLDGHDIRDLSLPSLRRAVATAFEDPTLFSMSVRENLTLGRPEASDAEVLRAIDVAQAQFVHQLPFGLDTRIGEQGMSLSGGQRQRLSLARAVLAEPAVLVLDDTLSALDVHTEALVEEALKRVLRRVTGIVVAHRASTVLIADRVALLDGNTITHVGTHAELLESVPRYRYLLAADLLDETQNGRDESSDTETDLKDEDDAEARERAVVQDALRRAGNPGNFEDPFSGQDAAAQGRQR
ncbi:ABC transporter ATP-binding protein [Dermacoccaceae bacterium W4C1]